MSLKISVRFLTENNDYEISADPSLSVLQFKELLRQQIPFFQRFSSIPTEVLKLSLEGFDGGGGQLTGNVMEDGRPLSAYPLREERHPVLLALERPVEKIVCPACQQPFVQWSSDRLCCGDAKEAMEGQEGKLEKRKARIPQLLNCGHSVCLECWREGLVAAAAEAMAEEKEFVLVDPSLLTEEGLARQNRMALEKAEEKTWRRREREKAENVWKFVCCEKSCGVVTCWRRDQERSCHGGMQRLVHLKKREWVEAERARGRCSIKTCGAEAFRTHQCEDMSDHVPQVLLSSQVHPSISDIFKTRFCCYCGGGETTSSCVRGGGRPHCEHRDAGLVSASEMTRARAMEQLTTLGSLQADCWRQLVTWNGVMEQLQEHRVKGVERIRKEFDVLISRLEARKEVMVTELRRRYREKEMELMEKMEALGVLSGELEAGLVHHRQSLAELALSRSAASGGGAEVCVVREVVDMNAVQEKMSQLASEASRESLARFSEISMEFEGCEFCRISELDNMTPTQPKLSKKQKYQELEQRVAVLSQELNVATTALNTSTAREAAVRAELDQRVVPALETSQPKPAQPNLSQTTSQPPLELKAEVKTTSNNQTTTADSKSTVATQPKPSQVKSLLEAANKGSLEEVEYLVRNGVNVNCKGWIGNTPLHCSAVQGNLELVKCLLQLGADVNCKNERDGWTPLHCSARGGRLEVVKYLLQQGADIHCKTNGGCTPVHLSANGGHLEVVKYLLQQGADKTIKDKSNKTQYIASFLEVKMSRNN